MEKALLATKGPCSRSALVGHVATEKARIAERAKEETSKILSSKARRQVPPPDIDLHSSESAVSSLSSSPTKKMRFSERQTLSENSTAPPAIDATDVKIGSTETYLRGFGLGSQVDGDELQHGDEIRLVPDPSNKFDRNAVRAVTSDDVYIGNVNKSHAKAGFSQMLCSVAGQKITHRATFKSFGTLNSWNGTRRESAVVRVNLSFFGTRSKVPSLHRIMKKHELPFHVANVDASSPTPGDAEAKEVPATKSATSTTPSVDSEAPKTATPSTSSSTSSGGARVSLPSACLGSDIRRSDAVKEGEVVDLTKDSDSE